MRLPVLLSLFALCSGSSPAEEEDWGGPPPAVPGAAAPLSYAVQRRAQLLKVRADGLYRARRYREACDLYLLAARLDSNDAAVRNDLALSYRNLGRKDSALAYARAALRLADRSLSAADTSSWSFPDLRARKTAYFILDKLGGPMPVPKPGRCETWFPADEACRARR